MFSIVKLSCFLLEKDLPPTIKKPSMDSRAELSTETVSHHLQPLDRPSAQKDSDMELDNGMIVCGC
ncbi:hypothetical protein DPMN_101717 [Dreissena polymorpha]|uniref:Uncharacterized protein n=1 Tax=Dreissena polymorpha TaxID=45954 RepID=A0A9D4LJG3_DREPO|nr:hypothetical protein DPMN_101717 [Dreissena polymorpha]